MNQRRAFLVRLLFLPAIVTWWPLGAIADPPMAAGVDPDQFRREVAKLVEELDSDRFSVRRQAGAKLEQLASQPELGPLLAEQFERVLIMPETSFEVRKRLGELCRDLPKVGIEPVNEVPAEELDRLVGQLEDDSYGVRLGATRRLEWLLGNPKLTCPILRRLRRRLAEEDLPPDAPRWLAPIYARARGAWLMSDPEGWDLPPVSMEQVSRWIDALVRPGAAGAGPGKRRAEEVAKQELWDVLARPKYLPRVKQALESRLAAGDLDGAASGRLQEFLDMTRPAMVAEYWEGRHHRSIQHLLVGVPSLSPGAPRPSHFDRIDDRVAHCVSGSNLTEGDYPVGVAIPHPSRETSFFHLVNLPTPRRRMAYEQAVKTDEAVRLAKLSRRTLDRFLAEKRLLTDAELLVLRQLDPKEVSRFAGKFFRAVADQPTPPEGDERTGWQSRPSRHATLCVFLATEGTREAAGGLLEAIDAGRFLPPSTEEPYRLAWLAALAIAARDPWPEVDAWLSGLLGRTEALVEGRPEAVELGATAAALLLKRHRQNPLEYGLEPVADRVMTGIGVSGYRFTSPESRRKVEAWWARQKPEGD